MALALGKNVRAECENVAYKPVFRDIHQSLTRKRGVDVFSLAEVEGGAVINDQLVVADGIFLLINGRNEVAFRLFLQRCERQLHTREELLLSQFFNNLLNRHCLCHNSGVRLLGITTVDTYD